ncbi:Two-component response regulator, AmiR/NasT family, consists of REC and RNA-binding antiterminator (ANTAR) domains [Roseovarius pacificus]|uniref:Two-component response regulator, AmiR/NasT family, consists of REC and RNA-binding antiterminator (ANTAR) domains n=1 Tax=Roseovarius pacificus TaxID=337701 RepID=A0A1M6ZZY4_9RHOB|nr:ANTAR domain-containing protein [Roseovarius pacificus]GGO54051.1 transcription antitermination regulator [Roseovarius pacificus]SHL35970.1 Two-component response regulator, AmiR/NasT family, consists of REC and RNA-binding antiterminator (ANTAR) domains [Roseovarius pacificus]
MSDPIQDLRDLHALVVHPRDRSADELMQQVNRIGCNFDHMWPVPKTLPEKFDLVFVDVTDQNAQRLKSFIGSSPKSPSVVAIIGYENPSVLDLIFEIGAHSVLMKPVRAAGVLSSMLMARRFQQEQLHFEKDLTKLREKLDNVQKVNDAKFILMRHRGITERQAYDLIRKQAMAKRATTTEIAQSIINAESILSNMGDT